MHFVWMRMNVNKLIKIFKQHGGQLRMSDAIKLGISRYTLYSMRDKGVVELVSRGIYRLVDLPPISNPDLVTVGLRFPNTVVCLVSALAYHELTTQIPHRVHIAISRNSRIPKLDTPPIQVYKFSDEAYQAGIESHKIDNITVQVYSPEKTIADCFKYRNKIGMDIVLEALKRYKENKKININKLIKYAKVCRVYKVMQPYLEAML